MASPSESSPTQSHNDLSAGSQGGLQTFVSTSRAVHLPQLTNFLSLAPTTSSSYPSSPSPLPTATLPLARAPKDTDEANQTGTPAVPIPMLDAELLKSSRSSSSGSDDSSAGSPTQRMRFLKLGPVHFGKDDGKGDWSEEVLAE